MKLLPFLSLAAGLGIAMCGPKDPARPAPHADAAAAHPAPEEKPMAEARWIEIAAAEQKFLIVKIAEGAHRPPGDFEGSAGPSGKTLFYLLVPHSAAAAEIGHESGGGKTALPRPRPIHRMPGSALYTRFFADPARPGTLAFKLGSKTASVPLDARTGALRGLPFFWSGDGSSIAFEEVPGWMESSGP